MTAVLGISAYFHDSAAAIVSDGRPLAAAQEERFSRRKHDASFPWRAIDFCLSQSGISSKQLDYVAFYERPTEKLDRVVSTIMAGLPVTLRALHVSARDWARRKLQVESTIVRGLGIRPSRVIFVDHHLSHASSAFLASPFDDAATLTIDGVGEWHTATLGHASRGNFAGSHGGVEIKSVSDFPHSLGLLYSTITSFLGFEINEGEFKVMGLAAYGTARYRDKIDRICRIHADGSLTLDMRYFEYHRHHDRMYGQRLVDLLGEPRRPGMNFGGGPALSPTDQRHADIAASVQEFTEDAVVAMAQAAFRLHPSKNLAYAGGVALNGLANRVILERTPFENLYIPSAPGDDGAALGCAQHVDSFFSEGTSDTTPADLGKGFSEEEIRSTLLDWGVKYTQTSDLSLIDCVAGSLADDKTVGWFQGRFEWGPRALGNRSILASPLHDRMKDQINRKIKFREDFRPFAPAVLAEYAEQYFDGPVGQAPARFMQFVFPIKESAPHQLPATNHFGTSRAQVVRHEENQLFADLLERFGKITGHPVLLNTSMNLRGEPMAASPADALSTFLRSDLDLLVLGDYIVAKE